MNTKQCFLAFFKLDDILPLDLVVSGHEEGFKCLALPFIVFGPSEVVLDLGLFDLCNWGLASLRLFLAIQVCTSATNLPVLGFYCK